VLSSADAPQKDMPVGRRKEGIPKADKVQIGDDQQKNNESQSIRKRRRTAVEL
jgi:hypothetical protein